jgi:putative ABC transport system permease protein
MTPGATVSTVLAASADVDTLSWTAVALTVVLVGAAVALAARQSLGLTRELVIAAVRAATQLAAVGAVLLVLFRYAGIPGSLAWAAPMVIVAGQVAGRSGNGIPRARAAATLAGPPRRPSCSGRYSPWACWPSSRASSCPSAA